MLCSALFAFVALPATWAVSNGQDLASSVNVICGVTAEEEYCLSVQGFRISEYFSMCGGWRSPGLERECIFASSVLLFVMLWKLATLLIIY